VISRPTSSDPPQLPHADRPAFRRHQIPHSSPPTVEKPLATPSSRPIVAGNERSGRTWSFAPDLVRIILFAEEDMNSGEPKRFSWNAGAMAGTAVGASLWMPATALASGWPVIGIAVALATACLILISAYLLWRLRQRISAFRGLMILLAIGFSATLLFFAAAHVLDLSLVDGWPGGKRGSALSYSWVLLLYPGLAAWFWLRNRDASNSESDRREN
jgi:hypothetical protein